MNSHGSHQMTRWQRDRRAFIEHRIYWHGSIGLADLMDVMEISRAQASKDLNGYISDHPDHLHYDKSARTYVMGQAFEAHYLSIDPAEYLADLAAIARGAAVPKSDWVVDLPDILAPTIPARGLNPSTVRNVLLACTQRRLLAVSYQSMSSPEPTKREIAPHGMAHDGFRWHARAWCPRDGSFQGLRIGSYPVQFTGRHIGCRPRCRHGLVGNRNTENRGTSRSFRKPAARHRIGLRHDGWGSGNSRSEISSASTPSSASASTQTPTCAGPRTSTSSWRMRPEVQTALERRAP